MSTENNIVPEVSAFALRASLRQSQSVVAHDRLFYQLGHHIFHQGWNEHAHQLCLDEVALLTGASHGAILQQHGGALKVLAQRGKAYPIGARIPMMGHLAQWLKSPVQFEVHDTLIPSLWTFSTQDYAIVEALHFQHLPIVYQHQAIGLLALACPQILKPEDKTSLHGLCGLLGAMLRTHQPQQAIIDDSILQKLTPREREIFAHLPSGASNAVLAEKLGIASGTVKIHIERILSKLNLNDRTQAAVKAVEMGFKSNDF